MAFSTIFGQREVTTRLTRAFEGDRLPSAYLFTGPDGLGKGTVVKAFAQMVNCATQNNCGKCNSCRLFAQRSHPDFIVIRAPGRYLQIAQVQDLVKRLSLKPMYSGKRVVLIKHAHQMTTEAANALLKILEEPPLDSLLILTATDSERLLETIVSRCQAVPFKRLSKAHVLAILEKDFNLAEDSKSLILNYCRGRLRKDFIEQASKLLAVRAQALEMILEPTPKRLPEFFHLIESWCKQNLEGAFLEFLGSWMRDLAMAHVNPSGPFINEDALDDIERAAPVYPREHFEQAFDLIIETEKAIAGNAAKQLALEGLVLRFKKLFAGAVVL